MFLLLLLVSELKDCSISVVQVDKTRPTDEQHVVTVFI